MSTPAPSPAPAHEPDSTYVSVRRGVARGFRGGADPSAAMCYGEGQGWAASSRAWAIPANPRGGPTCQTARHLRQLAPGTLLPLRFSPSQLPFTAAAPEQAASRPASSGPSRLPCGALPQGTDCSPASAALCRRS